MKRVMVPVFAVLTLLVPLGAGATAKYQAIFHQPVLEAFTFNCTSTVTGPTASACVALVDEAGSNYPKFFQTGITIRTTLYLPSGLRLVRSHIKTNAPAGLELAYKPAYADLHYKMVKNGRVSRPVWTFRHLQETFSPVWVFTVGPLSTGSPACVSAVAVAVGVQGAPVQRTKHCFVRQE